MRDVCGPDCPAPSLETECEPPFEPPSTMGFSLYYLDGVHHPGDYDYGVFNCEVIDASANVNEQGEVLEARWLDCAVPSQPTEIDDCEG